jgi:hypothetical protein
MPLTTYTAGEVLTASSLNGNFQAAGGLQYVTQASNSGTGTLSINNCFTSTYENYRIIINQTAMSGNDAIYLRMRVGGADDTTANYQYAANTATAAGGSSVMAGANQDTVLLGLVGRASPNAGSSIDIFSPQLTSRTWATTLRYEYDSVNYNSRSGSFVKDQITSFDGFTLIAGGGKTFSATVYVYGYRNL